MARYSYEIGSSLATMVNVEDLDSNVPNAPPRGLAVDPVSVRRVGADGKTYGDGYPTTQWEFDIINGAQLDKLLAYLGTAESAQVYIRTRTMARSYSYYKCIMHRPVIRKEIEPAFVERWKDVTIRFTMLELQADPEE